MADERELLPRPFCGGAMEATNEGAEDAPVPWMVHHVGPTGGTCPITAAAHRPTKVEARCPSYHRPWEAGKLYLHRHCPASAPEGEELPPEVASLIALATEHAATPEDADTILSAEATIRRALRLRAAPRQRDGVDDSPPDGAGLVLARGRPV